ncbi:hypothetical protein [Sphaerisporangium perillae]|uniref:hypothetical protein n=1 Tax=Sphaerisporangium perillae TaxID=2935860 RepID=UPI00200E7B89|nr:hypothetical protein [Sphaerisporangium perillae]
MPQTAIDLAREVVAELAPDELRDFDLVAQAHLAHPRAARRARDGRNEPNASAWATAAPILSGIVVAVITDLSKDLLLASGRSLGTRLKARFRRQRGDQPLPPYPPEQRAALLVHAHQSAIRHGADEETAPKIANAVAGHWVAPR